MSKEHAGHLSHGSLRPLCRPLLTQANNLACLIIVPVVYVALPHYTLVDIVKHAHRYINLLYLVLYFLNCSRL